MLAGSLFNRRIRIVLALALISGVTFTRPARADFVPTLQSANNGTYVYNLSFTTNGSEFLVSGDFMTFYDVAAPGSLTSVSIQSTPDDSVLLQPVGATPASLQGAAGLTDDPALLNVTVAFFGRFLDHNALVDVLTIQIAGGGSAVRPGTFASVDLLNSNGTELNHLGGVPLPTLVPEPISGFLFAALIPLYAHKTRPAER